MYMLVMDNFKEIVTDDVKKRLREDNKLQDCIPGGMTNR